jgi:hypothetical protein
MDICWCQFFVAIDLFTGCFVQIYYTVLQPQEHFEVNPAPADRLWVFTVILHWQFNHTLNSWNSTDVTYLGIKRQALVSLSSLLAVMQGRLQNLNSTSFLFDLLGDSSTANLKFPNIVAHWHRQLNQLTMHGHSSNVSNQFGQGP